jgi:hypothetical protein
MTTLAVAGLDQVCLAGQIGTDNDSGGPHRHALLGETSQAMNDMIVPSRHRPAGSTTERLNPLMRAFEQ